MDIAGNILDTSVVAIVLAWIVRKCSSDEPNEVSKWIKHAVAGLFCGGLAILTISLLVIIWRD